MVYLDVVVISFHFCVLIVIFPTTLLSTFFMCLGSYGRVDLTSLPGN